MTEGPDVALPEIAERLAVETLPVGTILFRAHHKSFGSPIRC